MLTYCIFNPLISIRFINYFDSNIKFENVSVGFIFSACLFPLTFSEKSNPDLAP